MKKSKKILIGTALLTSIVAFSGCVGESQQVAYGPPLTENLNQASNETPLITESDGVFESIPKQE